MRSTRQSGGVPPERWWSGNTRGLRPGRGAGRALGRRSEPEQSRTRAAGHIRTACSTERRAAHGSDVRGRGLRKTAGQPGVTGGLGRGRTRRSSSVRSISAGSGSCSSANASPSSPSTALPLGAPSEEEGGAAACPSSSSSSVLNSVLSTYPSGGCSSSAMATEPRSSRPPARPTRRSSELKRLAPSLSRV